MEIDEEYIDKVKSLIEQKDAENVKTLLTDLHPADIDSHHFRTHQTTGSVFIIFQQVQRPVDA